MSIDDDVLVDGGVVNNVPISRALAAGCDRIYVLLCGPLHYHPRPPRRPAEAALTAFFVAIHARFVRELASLPPGVEVVVFSGGGEPSGQYRDFSATATLIEEGRAEVADVLDRYVGTSHDLAHPAPTRPPRDATAPRTPTAICSPTTRPRRWTASPRSPRCSTLRPSATSTGSGWPHGWRCWEVGAGGTTVVAHLAERVGPGGHVLATDINLSWATGAAGPNVEILEHDVAAAPPPGAPLRPRARPPRPGARARARRSP